MNVDSRCVIVAMCFTIANAEGLRIQVHDVLDIDRHAATEVLHSTGSCDKDVVRALLQSHCVSHTVRDLALDAIWQCIG